jgi:hypothetical protein
MLGHLALAERATVIVIESAAFVTETTVVIIESSAWALILSLHAEGACGTLLTLA